jgi:hypothetical protein
MGECCESGKCGMCAPACGRCEGECGGSCGPVCQSCAPCGEEEECCPCKCHFQENLCDACSSNTHMLKMLGKKAMMKLLMDKVKERMDKKYGKKLDAVADSMVEHMEAHWKLKKEMARQEGFDLKEKLMEVFKEE